MNNYKNRKASARIRKTALLVAVVLLLVAVAGFVFYRQSQSTEVVDPAPTQDSEEFVSPPTDEDRLEAERHKEWLIAEQEADNTKPPEGTKQEINPVIGFLRQADNKNIEANGYITEAIESDGTCTLTLERNGQKVTKSKQAMPDAQSTVCGLITIERSQLSAGEWKATITYSSSRYEGVSDERTVKVE